MTALDLNFDLSLLDVVNVCHHAQTFHISSKVERLRINILLHWLRIHVLLLWRLFEHHLSQKLTLLF